MIYLDHASTTPLDCDILAKMLPYLTVEFGNASSVHSFGRAGRIAIERSRGQVAKALGVEQGEVLFVGSASEGNNLIVKGVVESIIRQNIQDFLPEIVVSAIEHPCVMESVRHAERLGWVKVRWVGVDEQGRVLLADIEEAINERTVLVSVMYVNNEIGAVQPIREIGELVKKQRKLRKNNQLTSTTLSRAGNNHGILPQTSGLLPIWFHTDAVQAVQYFNCRPKELGVDLMTLAAHKCYGPKGVGVVYKTKGVDLVRQVDGGGQEYYLRAGTENVPNIVGAGEAFERAIESADLTSESKRLYEIRERLISQLQGSNTQVLSSKDASHFAPHILSIIVPEVEAEMLVGALDREGFAVSSGSACSSGVVRKSHVMEALNLGYERYAPIRVSMGRGTTSDEVESFVKVFCTTMEKIKALAFN